MDGFNFENVPSWAFSWCFFFLFTGIVSLASGVSALFMGKRLGFSLTLLYLLAALAQGATAFTLFWMCRRSLAGTAEVAKGEWYAAQFTH